MPLAVAHSRALSGLTATAVAVEVNLANGLPSFGLVGLADVEVKEARERVRAAILNAGLQFPHNKRITVSLAPADLPKDSGRFDLPIAMGILAASGQVDEQALTTHVFAGELSLSGALRPVRGALAMALASSQEPVPRALVLPPGSAEEAALVSEVRVYRAEHLLDVVARFPPGPEGQEAPLEARTGWSCIAAVPPSAEPEYPDLADVKGQGAARRALEIAAAGTHSLLLSGPPGAGKSMLAHRLAGLLPALARPEALQSAALASLAGRFDLRQWARRPTCSPHHSASAVALVGGGVPPRPGEISLAHHGVLFLDELPEFPRAALEALREPLETGSITIARAARRCEFPARFQLIAAMNPCPCGWLGSARHACRCTPDQVVRYQGRLSGPLLDRIDLHVEVGALDAAELLQASPGESSAAVRQRSVAAHERAQQRQGCANAALQGRQLDAQCRLDGAGAAFLQRAATRLGWSARASHRVMKVARTIADLAGSETIALAHLAEAAQYRPSIGPA
jgi:magnesium chelatase family protein